MKKVICVLFSIVILLFTFTGCSNETYDESKSNNSTMNLSVDVTIISPRDNFNRTIVCKYSSEDRTLNGLIIKNKIGTVKNTSCGYYITSILDMKSDSTHHWCLFTKPAKAYIGQTRFDNTYIMFGIEKIDVWSFNDITLVLVEE